MAKRKTSETRKAAKRTSTFHVGSMLRDHILAKGLNQAEVARRSYMTPQALSGIFKRNTVQLETLIRLSLATEHDFLADVSVRTLGTISRTSLAEDPAVNYTRRPERAPIRFVIEADPDDQRTMEQVTHLLRELKGN